MKRALAFLTVLFLLVAGAAAVRAGNPFTSRTESAPRAPEPLIKSRFFVHIILWQHQLKQKMSDLIRATESGGGVRPLLWVLGIAFLYGMVHSAGPGHGKVVASSYVLSHQAPLKSGLLFGVCFAFIHGFSGVVGVVGLHYVIQRSVSETLASATAVTQIVSFGLIALLGIFILVKHVPVRFPRTATETEADPASASPKGVLPWAAAVGLIPCPAVVMVMLFCISMEAMILGVWLAVCISLGMATTISLVVMAVILGKAGFLRGFSTQRAAVVEGWIALFSGAGIALFGSVFLLASLHTALV